MAKLITDERTKYTEHWVIDIKKGKVSVVHSNFPEKDGYDYINIKAPQDKIRIVVHELARLEEILKTGFLSEKVKENIRKELANV